MLCNRFIAAKLILQVQVQQHIFLHQLSKPLFYISNAPFSSPSLRKSSSLHNYYLRKRRKWPIQPYTEQYPQRFAFQLAMRSFKQSIKKSRDHLLCALIDSFATYEIDPSSQAYHFLFKVTIHKHSSHHQIPQILDHVEKVEKFETPECIFIDLIKFYGKNYMFSEAVELFFRIPKFRCEPSVEALNALLFVLCRDEKGLNMVPEILRKSLEINIRIEESSFRILIRALCGIGKVSGAFHLLCCMADEGFTADQKLLSYLLAAKCGQLNNNEGDIKAFLWDLKMLGFEPRKDDFCNVIRYLVKIGKGKGALEVLRQMKMERVKADVMCYNLVLDGLFCDREFSRADKVFDELLVLGLVPDVHTYNVYIWGLCVQNKVEEGIKMMASMEDLGCEPNLNSYISILTALCEAGELHRVREVMNEMNQKNVQLNSETYEIMIDRLVSNGDVVGACSFLKEMLESNFKFVYMPTALDKILSWLCSNGLYFKAVELLGEVIVKDIAPGAEAWQALIHGSGITYSFETFVNLARI